MDDGGPSAAIVSDRVLSGVITVCEGPEARTAVPAGVCGGLFAVCFQSCLNSVDGTNVNRIVIIQFLALLPTVFTYLLPKEGAVDDRLPVPQWPSEFTTNRPSHCLSYNPRSSDAAQYAIAAGCTGAKADLWLHGTDLLVGSSFADLDVKHTLRTLYLDPLLAKLDAKRKASGDSEAQHGLFEDPAQSFVLVLEFKTWQHAALSELDSHLYGLRQGGYLTRMNGSEVIPGPVTVVVTGQGEHHVRAGHDAEHDEIFFDASLDELTMKDYDQPWKLTHRVSSNDNKSRDPNTAPTNPLEPQKGLSAEAPSSTIYSATAHLIESIGYPRRGRFSPQQIALLRAQVHAAHRRGLRVRYEGILQGQGRLSDYIWRVLVREGVDMIDVDWKASYHRAWWQQWFTYRPTSD